MSMAEPAVGRKSAQFDARSDDYASQAIQHHHSASVKDQLNAWHAGRGDRSFVASLFPSIRSSSNTAEHVTKNPITLLRMVSGFGWIMFFSVSALLYRQRDVMLTLIYGGRDGSHGPLTDTTTSVSRSPSTCSRSNSRSPPLRSLLRSPSPCYSDPSVPSSSVLWQTVSDVNGL